MNKSDYKSREDKKNRDKKYYEKNKDKIKIKHKKYQDNSRKELSDQYMKSLLVYGSKILKRGDIPKELIEAKRLEVQIKRITKGKQ